MFISGHTMIQITAGSGSVNFNSQIMLALVAGSSVRPEMRSTGYRHCRMSVQYCCVLVFSIVS